MKCSSCLEVWFQLPDTEELKEQGFQGFEEIPEGVKPLPEGANLPAVQAQKESAGTDPLAGRMRVLGYAAAAAVFFAVLGLLIGLRGPISEFAPVSHSFYAMLGYAKKNPAEGLVFDSLDAKAAPDLAGEKIEVSGKILNPTDVQVRVPPLVAQIKNAHGEVVESWIVDPPAPVIEAGSDFYFTTDYLHAVIGTAHEVSLTFSGNRD